MEENKNMVDEPVEQAVIQQAIMKAMVTSADPKEGKKAFSLFGGAYLGAGILNIVPAVLILVLAMRFSPGMENNTTFRFIISIVTLYFVGLPFAYMIVKNIPKCEIGNKKLHPGYVIASLFIGYAVVVISNVVGTVINFYFGELTGKGVMNPIANTLIGLNPVINILIVAILAPIIEELVFRKILVDRLYKYGEGLTILFSGLMFGLFHANFAQFFYAFAVGVYFAYIYMRTGRIRYTIYIHIFINGIGSLASFALSKIDVDLIVDYMEAGKVEEYMAYVMENTFAFALLGFYGILVIGIVITGIILMLVFYKKFHINIIPTQLSVRDGLASMFGNPGMIAYVAFFVIAIILAQYGTSIATVIMNLFV